MLTLNLLVMSISLKDCMLNVVFQIDHVVVMIGGLVWGRVGGY